MTDLIDRNSLLNSLEKFAPEKHDALVEMLIKKEPTVDADKALRKAARKLAYIHTQIDLYDDRPELHEEAYWLEYLIDEDWKDGQID